MGNMHVRQCPVEFANTAFSIPLWYDALHLHSYANPDGLYADLSPWCVGRGQGLPGLPEEDGNLSRGPLQLQPT